MRTAPMPAPAVRGGAGAAFEVKCGRELLKQTGSGMLRGSLFITLLFLVSVFSVDGFASRCPEGSYSTDTGTAYIDAAPDDPVRNYTEGYARYCQGREWRYYIEKSSDLGHVTASYFLGEHHRKDKDPNSSTSLPKTQEDYDAAIFYYERAATDIENMSSYPRRPDGKVHEAEAAHYVSIRTFLHLTNLYFNGYSFALGDILGNDVSYADTIKVLDNMRNAADRCLRRPSLAIWGVRQSEIANSKRVICQAQKDFAEQALDLESQRIEIAKRCDVVLSECVEHQNIFQELVRAANDMDNKVNSVPKV